MLQYVDDGDVELILLGNWFILHDIDLKDIANELKYDPVGICLVTLPIDTLPIPIKQDIYQITYVTESTYNAKIMAKIMKKLIK